MRFIKICIQYSHIWPFAYGKRDGSSPHMRYAMPTNGRSTQTHIYAACMLEQVASILNESTKRNVLELNYTVGFSWKKREQNIYHRSGDRLHGAAMYSKHTNSNYSANDFRIHTFLRWRVEMWKRDYRISCFVWDSTLLFSCRSPFLFFAFLITWMNDNLSISNNYNYLKGMHRCYGYCYK